MPFDGLPKLLAVALCLVVPASVASDGSEQAGEAFIGFLLALGFFVVMYLLVLLIRLIGGGERRAGRLRDMNAIEFARSTTSIDRATIER